MKIIVITPAHKESKSGNRTTAARWARLLKKLGHRVEVAVEYDGKPADAMIALHAWRSAAAITRFRELFPDRPLVVALTGTDLYHFLHQYPDMTLASMKAADILVGLHDLVAEAIPASLHPKLRIVYQSAQPVPGRRNPSKRHFEVCVVANLRAEKDPLRTAMAVRELPEDSRIHVIHMGRAHEEAWAAAAEAETERNPRYRWRGEVPFGEVRRILSRSHVMVLSSRMEGGANVISEAVVAKVPVIASHIPGSVGLLGREYPGYYPLADTIALRDMLLRAERESAFLRTLARHCAARAPLFRESRERNSLRQIVAELRRR